jgi:hypothetical protein
MNESQRELKKDNLIIKSNSPDVINSTPKCPICNDIGYKVSAIYASGTSETHSYGSAITYTTPFSSKESSSISFTPIHMNSYSISGIAKKVVPPNSPKKPSRVGFTVFLILTVLTTLAGGIVALSFGYLGIFISGLLWGGLLGAIITFIPFFIFIILFLVLTIVFSVRIKSGVKKYNDDLPLWDKAMGVWDKLYYCPKHDIVFNPETDEYAPVDLIHTLVYR